MYNNLKDTLTSAFFIIILLLALSLIALTPLISMVFLGAIFGYLINPVSRWMESKLKFKSITVFLAMLIVLTPLIILVAIVINGLIQTVPLAIVFAKNLNLTNLNSTTIQNYPFISHYIPANVYPDLNSALSAINTELSNILRGILDYIVKILESIPMALLQLFIFFASTFYFARDGDKIWEYIDIIIPSNRKHYFYNLFKETDKVLKSIFVGHFLTAIITGIIAGVGFYLLGYPYSLFFGVLTGFFQLIPFIGHWPIPILLAIHDFSIGNYIRAIAVLLLAIGLNILDFYIRPYLSGKYADIHPLIFMLGFISGPLIFGIVGFIIGPLILGVTYAAVLAYKKEIEDRNIQLRKD